MSSRPEVRAITKPLRNGRGFIITDNELRYVFALSAFVLLTFILLAAAFTGLALAVLLPFARLSLLTRLSTLLFLLPTFLPMTTLPLLLPSPLLWVFLVATTIFHGCPPCTALSSGARLAMEVASNRGLLAGCRSRFGLRQSFSEVATRHGFPAPFRLHLLL
jgi:hypothetical protein